MAAWPEHQYTVRPAALRAGPTPSALEEFVPDGQPELAALHNREHDWLTGTAVRPTYRHTKMPSCRGTGLLCRDGAGHVAGYVVADVSRDGTILWHSDSAGDPHQRLRVLGAFARERAQSCTEVRFPRLPYHAPLAAALRSLGCREESTHRANGGWMVRVIDAAGVFRALAPELGRRLQASPLASWSGALVVSTGDSGVELRLREGHVDVRRHSGPAPDNGTAVSIATDALGQLVLGSRAPAEIAAAGRLELPGAAPALVDVLFPPQLPQLGNGDL